MAYPTKEGLSPSANTQDINPFVDQNTPWYDKPHNELVADIQKSASAQRAKQEASGKQFDPVFWVSDLLTRNAIDATDTTRQNRTDLSDAWDVISQPFVKSPDTARP